MLEQQCPGDLQDRERRTTELYQELTDSCGGKHRHAIWEYHQLVEDDGYERTRAFFNMAVRLGRVFERQRKALLLGEE